MKKAVLVLAAVLACCLAMNVMAADSVCSLNDFLKRYNEASFQNGTEHTITEDVLQKAEDTDKQITYQLYYNPYELLQISVRKGTTDVTAVLIYYTPGAENEEEMVADFEKMVREVLYGTRVAEDVGDSAQKMMDSVGYHSDLDSGDSRLSFTPEGIMIGFMERPDFGIWFFVQTEM